MGSSNSRDSSFLCLLAIYGVHVLLFHVLAVVPLMGKSVLESRATLRQQQLSESTSLLTSFRSNDSQPLVADSPSDSSTLVAVAVARQQFHHEIFVSSSSGRSWESSVTNLIYNYSKAHVDFSLLSHYFHRIKNIFITAAWSSSTWGVISGCAIFLLTYTERENAH